MRLTTILTAAVLSSGLACNIEPATIIPNYESGTREERIEWRSELGIQAAYQFVFNHCIPIENLEEALREYGEPHALSARDVAESIAWGLYHNRYQLPPSNAETLRDYINEKIDLHGDRFVTITDILYNEGEYNTTINENYYDIIRFAIRANNPQHLKRRVGFGLTIAQFLNNNFEQDYQELRNYWNQNSVEIR